MFEKLNGSALDRRSFLRGSALFAGAIGVLPSASRAVTVNRRHSPSLTISVSVYLPGKGSATSCRRTGRKRGFTR